MISVCMVVCIGELYLAQLLESTLIQLSADDEVVIVDAVCSDGTRGLIADLMIQEFGLPTMKKHISVQETFKSALRLAR